MWILLPLTLLKIFSNLSRRDFCIWSLYDIFSLGFCKFRVPRASQQIAETEKCLSELPRRNGAMHFWANCRRHNRAIKLYNCRNLTLKNKQIWWELNSPLKSASLRSRLCLFFSKLLQVFPNCRYNWRKNFMSRVVFRASHLMFLLAPRLHNFFYCWKNENNFN